MASPGSRRSPCATSPRATKTSFRPVPLFILIGAEPATDWLPPSITRDRWGYILTGDDVERRNEITMATEFETAVPGVYAVGDVRHGSTKRVASAVGEGSECIRHLYQRQAAAAS